ncbi:MAG: DUF616 domain-containing protein [Bacilli bacterium]|nr:DUF616 domain-containing protein [Bacilli bacterium]
MKNKICVYTCITGDYDEIKEIKKREKGIDYYLFTNNKNIKSYTWKVEYIEDKSLSNVLLARKTKILGNDIVNKYDIALWMDAAVEFKSDINDFINKYFKSNDVFACFKHGIRNSILEEMDACLRFRKEDYSKIENLKKFYEKEKYNYDNGLIESTVYIKRPNDKTVRNTMNIWFDMVNNYTKRDQLSFNYAISKTKLKVRWIDENVFDNSWFRWHEHNFNKMPKNYMIYFGKIDEYNYNKQYSNEYKVNKDECIINTKVLNDCNEIYVELSTSMIIKYEIIDINSKCNIYRHNTIKYLNEDYFFKNPGFIILDGNFKKGFNLEIRIKFELVDESIKNELIEYLVIDRERIDSERRRLEFDNKNLQDVYNSVVNSSSWKLTKPLRGVKNVFGKKGK